MESMRYSVFPDDCIYGYSVPGTYDPAGFSLRWHLWSTEQPYYSDPYACGIFPFHGNLHVPRCNHTSVPMELEEAAFIDGCTRWQTYWKIVFPLLKPTIATVAIIDAMAFWNDYLLPSLVLGRKELYTLPIATQAFYGTYSTDLGLVMAALLLAMLPILVLYLFLQRYIVEGVTSGAVKG